MSIRKKAKWLVALPFRVARGIVRLNLAAVDAAAEIWLDLRESDTTNAYQVYRQIVRLEDPVEALCRSQNIDHQTASVLWHQLVTEFHPDPKRYWELYPDEQPDLN